MLPPAFPAAALPAAAGPAAAPIQPAAAQPASVQPGAPRPRMPQQAMAPPTRELQAGDLICGECGEGNDSVRKFCSRCGTSLSVAAVHTIPWYRRLIPRRRPTVLAAGERPGRGGARSRHPLSLGSVIRMLRVGLFAVLFVGALLYSASAPFRTLVSATVERPVGYVKNLLNPQFNPVHAIDAFSPTGPAPGTPHEPRAAIDGYKTSYWSTPWRRDVDTYVKLTLPGAANVDKMLFSLGDSDDFAAQPRPKHVKLIFSNLSSQEVNLADKPDPQQVDIENGKDVTWVEIHITEVFPAFKGTDVSIAEVEMFTRQ